MPHVQFSFSKDMLSGLCHCFGYRVFVFLTLKSLQCTHKIYLIPDCFLKLIVVSFILATLSAHMRQGFVHTFLGVRMSLLNLALKSACLVKVFCIEVNQNLEYVSYQLLM